MYDVVDEPLAGELQVVPLIKKHQWNTCSTAVVLPDLKHKYNTVENVNL